jgi:hypothetical protein
MKTKPMTTRMIRSNPLSFRFIFSSPVFLDTYKMMEI